MKFNLCTADNKKIGIFTDLHCGVEKDSTEKLEETEKCIDWIIKTFKKADVDWVFFLGDFFHSRFGINTKTLQTGIKCINKLNKAFEKVICICGNHDTYYAEINDINSIDYFEQLGNESDIITVIKEPYYIKAGNKTLGLYPWGSEKLIEDSSLYMKTDYAFGHFEGNGFLQPGGVSEKMRVNMNDLFSFSGYIFSGHYHINKLYGDNSGRNKLQMVGSPLQLNWSDFSLKKYIYTLDTSSDQIEKFENTVNSTYQKVFYSKLEKGEYTDSALNKICLNNYIKFVIDSKYDFNKILEYSEKLKEYKLKNIETEYLVSLASDLLITAENEFNSVTSKSNIDYMLDYIDRIFDKISAADPEIDKDVLKTIIKNKYASINNSENE